MTSIGHVVAFERGAVGRLQLGESLAQPVDPLVDVGLGDLRARARDLQPRVVGLGELESRTHLDRGGEHERGVVGEALEVDLGVGDRREVLVRRGLAVVLRHGVLEELLAHDVATDLGVDDRLRRLALAEPGILTSRAIAR